MKRCLPVLAAALLAGAASAQLTPKVDEPFPLLTFPRLGADTRTSLAAFRGKKVLLVQFASW